MASTASLTLYVSHEDWVSSRVRIVAALAGADISVVSGKDAAAACKTTSARTLPLLHTHTHTHTHGEEGLIGGTNAILRHVAELRRDAELAGATAFEAGLVDGWLDWVFTDLDVLLHTVKEAGGTASSAGAAGSSAGAAVKAAAQPGLAAALAQARAKLPTALALLNKHLSSRTYMVGERLSLADIAAGTAVHEAVRAREVADVHTLPHVARWLATFQHVPAVARVLGQLEPVAAVAAPAPAGRAGAAAAPAPTAASATVSSGAAAMPQASTSATALPAALTAFETVLPKERFRRTRQRIAEVMLAGESLIGQSITVCGWARTIREQASATLFFLALSDGSTAETLQVIAEAGKVTEGFEELQKHANKDASFRVIGDVVKSPAKGQSIELVARKVEVLGAVQDPAHYPVPKTRVTLEYLREIQHLRPRTNTISAIARIRNACAYATHKFFQDRGFLYVHTPIITGSDCEGAGEMFQVSTLMPAAGEKPKLPLLPDGTVDYKQDFFAKPAFLTVSGQLQVEAYACALSDVYTFGPTFRAENSHTARHLAEFWMIEPEISFATLEDDMALAEDYLKYCTRFVLDHCIKDLEFFEAHVEKGLRARLENVVAEPFQRLTYTEAIELLTKPEHLKAGKFEVKPEWGIDLGSEHERYLTEKVYKKPVILINYPKDIKAFYMKLNPDGKTVAAMDVLVPKVGEIIGGSQREDDFEKLRKRMAEMGVVEEPLKWYMDLRKYGTAPHAGFGLGFERLVMYVTGLENIRDAIPFPRWPGNAAL